MDTKRLMPAEGRFARDPVTKRPLDEAGEEKVLDTFWLRRLAAGDVVEAPTAAADTPTGTPSGAADLAPAREEGGDGEAPAAGRRKRGA